jgi:hypothetical protein
MNGVFDIAAAVAVKTASFLEQTGIAPAVCCVSRETYRALVERNATVSDLGYLIIGTYAVTGIATDTAQLRIVIDEMLSGTELCVE